MYPFLTLDDDTVIVHSEMKPDGSVKFMLKNLMQKIASIVLIAYFPCINGKWLTVFQMKKLKNTKKS